MMILKKILIFSIATLAWGACNANPNQTYSELMAEQDKRWWNGNQMEVKYGVTEFMTALNEVDSIDYVGFYRLRPRYPMTYTVVKQVMFDNSLAIIVQDPKKIAALALLFNDFDLKNKAQKIRIFSVYTGLYIYMKDGRRYELNMGMCAPPRDKEYFAAEIGNESFDMNIKFVCDIHKFFTGN